MTGIYKITSPSGRIYIGQSLNIHKRFRNYKLMHNCSQQKKLYNSLKKYGPENHVFEIIIECEPDNLNRLERYYQDLYNVIETGLNLKLTGYDDVKYEHAPEVKERIRKTLISNAKKDGYINPMKGRKGKLNPFFGKKHSEESIKKAIQSRAWYKPSEETIEKNRQAQLGERNHFFGKSHTVESRSKISAVHKGKIIPEWQKQLISRANKGKIVSEETKAKMKLNNAHNKKVINTKTGEIYVSASDAARKIGLVYSSFAARLNGNRVNNTNFRYL